MSKLEDIISGLNKNFKTNIIGDKNTVSFCKKDTIPFATPSLSFLFHGGLPTNSAIAISMLLEHIEDQYDIVLVHDDELDHIIARHKAQLVAERNKNE